MRPKKIICKIKDKTDKKYQKKERKDKKIFE